MPHVIVEYSANLDDGVTPRAMVDAVHAAVLASGVFPLGGVRTRAAPRAIYRIADGNPEHAFVAVLMRIGTGRDAATRKSVVDSVLAALSSSLPAAVHARGLALSVEIQEIDEAGVARSNNLHKKLAEAASAR